MPLGTEVDHVPGHTVLDGVPAPGKSDTTLPHISAHVRWGQTAASGWHLVQM